MTFTAGLALAFATVLSGSNVTPAIAQAQPMPQAQTVQQYTKDYFADIPVMYAIAGCESKYRQYDTDGSILKNPNSSAIGVMQIMSSVHEKSAADLGIDIHTTQGNLAYARYIYDNEGTAPWAASKACWGNPQTSKAVAITTK